MIMRYLIIIFSLLIVGVVHAQVVNSDLLWSANTYIPAGYEGKALATPESLVYVTLFPRPPASFTYEWRVDDRFQSIYSGAGSYSMWFTAHPTSDFVHRVDVLILNSSGAFLDQKAVFIPVVDPKVIVYEESPLSGPFFNRAVMNLSVFSGEKKELKAVPYFFSKEDFFSFRYSWFRGGTLVQEGLSRVLTLPLEGGLGGVLDIIVENTSTFLQKARSSFVINVK